MAKKYFMFLIRRLDCGRIKIDFKMIECELKMHHEERGLTVWDKTVIVLKINIYENVISELIFKSNYLQKGVLNG